MDNKDANTLSNIYKIEDDTCLILFDDTDNQGYKISVNDFSKIVANPASIGNTSELHTNDKDTVVGAINEIKQNITNLSNEINQIETKNVKNTDSYTPDGGKTYWWNAKDNLQKSLNTIAGYAYTAYTTAKSGVTSAVVRNVGKLKFSGGATATYDGSSDVTVNIPKTSPTTGRLYFTGGSTDVFDGSKDITVNIPSGGGGGSSSNKGTLTFTGGFTGSYDGSSNVTVVIPTGSGGGGGSNAALTGVIYASNLPNNGTDCTSTLQNYIDTLWSGGGGTIYLPAGTFGIKTLNMHSKVSLVGAGIGITCLKHIAKGSHSGILYFPEGSGACVIRDLYIDGNYSQVQDTVDGIHIKTLENDYSGMYGNELGTIVQRFYGYQNKIADSSHNTYKNIYFVRVVIAYCGGWGAYIGRINYAAYIDYCFVYNCTYGVKFACMDSFISNTDIEYCSKTALDVAGGNSKFINMKILWNGRNNAGSFAALFTSASRCMITNVEFQDNWCSDLNISSDNIIATGLLLDTSKHINVDYEDMLYVQGKGNIIHATVSNYADTGVAKKKYGFRAGAVSGCRITVTMKNGAAVNNYSVPSSASGQCDVAVY